MLRIDAVTKVFPPPRGIQRLMAKTASPDNVTALRSVDLHVERGEVVGLIGPNGAGKTTLIKIISTLLDPTSGSVTIDGFDPVDHPLQVRKRIGLVLTDDRSLYWRLTGQENLEFFGVMQGLTHSQAQGRSAELLERLGLAHRDKMVFGYSSGMRSRLSIARALLCSPPLLILDEPTRALDPVAATDIGQLIRRTAGDGVAVLLSSHRLDEIEAVCDRIVALVDGQVRFSGTVDELRGDRAFAEALHELLTDDRGPESLDPS
jgi:ABC-2 type transport system ATP-binding protein